MYIMPSYTPSYYGVTIWGSASKTSLTPLYILQNNFVRMASFNETYIAEPGPLAHAPLFLKLKLLTIFDICKLQLGKLVYDSLNNIGPTRSIIQFTRTTEVHSHSSLCDTR